MHYSYQIQDFQKKVLRKPGIQTRKRTGGEVSPHGKGSPDVEHLDMLYTLTVSGSVITAQNRPAK